MASIPARDLAPGVRLAWRRRQVANVVPVEVGGTRCVQVETWDEFGRNPERELFHVDAPIGVLGCARCGFTMMLGTVACECAHVPAGQEA